jgi:hypothetical protein
MYSVKGAANTNLFRLFRNQHLWRDFIMSVPRIEMRKFCGV